MRNLEKEIGESLALSAAKVEQQRKVVDAMDPHDPNIDAERRLLAQMEQSASSARLNKALIEYNSEEA